MVGRNSGAVSNYPCGLRTLSIALCSVEVVKEGAPWLFDVVVSITPVPLLLPSTVVCAPPTAKSFFRFGWMLATCERAERPVPEVVVVTLEVPMNDIRLELSPEDTVCLLIEVSF